MEEVIKKCLEDMSCSILDKPTLELYLKNSIFNKLLLDGTALTPELALERYKGYDNYWNSLYGTRDPKYIATKDRKMGFFSFLVKGEYNKIYKSVARPKDTYLFGNNTIEYLIKKLKTFLNG
jgi:hypothetical protein